MHFEGYSCRRQFRLHEEADLAYSKGILQDSKSRFEVTFLVQRKRARELGLSCLNHPLDEVSTR